MLKALIQAWLAEDIGVGDHSTMAAISPDALGTAKLLVKEKAVIAGLRIASEIYQITDPKAEITWFKKDGDLIVPGDIAFIVKGNARNILSTERLILNCMQRMSGIATQTNVLTQKIAHTKTRLLDTRKTTPGFRLLEKEAVIIGGGLNHRYGLYDMIMLKDNHIDFCGGITQAVNKVKAYQLKNTLHLPIEVEVRNEIELMEAIKLEGVQRIMLDNFSPALIGKLIHMIPEHFEIEASGGITEQNIVSYAESGVHFISVGALTHHVKSIDMSLKALIH